MTDWDRFQARVHPGDGIVARTAGGALVLPGVTAEHQEFVDQLLALLRDARPGGGRVLVRRLAGILASSDEEPAALALLAPLGGGDLAVLVVGNIDLSADGAEGPVRLSGRDCLTWVDRVLRAPTQVHVTAGSSAGSAMYVSDLVAGIVPGSGLTMSPRGDRAAPSVPQRSHPALAAGAPAEPLSAPLSAPPSGPPIDYAKPPIIAPTPVEAPLSDPVPESLAESEPPSRAPLPVDEPAAPLEAGSEPLVVKGVFCTQGHFNDPMVQFCPVCGINMVQQTPALVDGPRPPLGVLVFDDGSVFQLEQDCVIGRQPEGAQEVISGAALPLRVADSGGTVSRAHALIALEDWSVRLSDHGSANGTYITMPGSSDWQQVAPNGGVVLTPGTTIKLGNRTLKYESHRGPR